MYSDRLDALITPDQEAIVLLAHKLCVSERKRLAWQKTAEMEQDRADENEGKFRRTREQLDTETAHHAVLVALYKQNEAHAAPYEFQVWNCHNVCVDQWTTYDEAVRSAALWDTPRSAAPYRVVKVYLDAPPAPRDRIAELEAERCSVKDENVVQETVNNLRVVQVEPIGEYEAADVHIALDGAP